jgi:CheY-like chemotaxis protein
MAHILIAEDDPANAELAVLICRQAGHTTRLVSDGAAALRRLLERERFDLILLDVLMPEVDGIEVAMALKASPRHAAIPIIGVTAVAGERDRDKLRAAGMAAVVTKPYRPEALRRAIAEALPPAG